MKERKTRVEECWILAPKDLAGADVDALTSTDSLRIAFRAKHRSHFGTIVSLGFRCRRIETEGGSQFVLQFLVSYCCEPRVQFVGIAETKPHLGGARTWLVCDCGRRVGKLYLPHDDEALRSAKFACRICLDLSYRSAQEAHEYERRERRLAKIHEQYEELVRRRPELAIERLPDGPFARALRLGEVSAPS